MVKWANAKGWDCIAFQEKERMISFSKDGCRINIYYTTGTVGTALRHPRQGPTQVFRRNVSGALLQQIFLNPRQHTGIGYQKIYKGTRGQSRWKVAR